MDYRKSIEVIKKAISSGLPPEMLDISWRLHREIAVRLQYVFPSIDCKEGKHVSEIDIEAWQKEHSMHASPSGVIWKFAVDSEGDVLPFKQWEGAFSFNKLYAVHHIAVSFRGPVLFHGRQLVIRDTHPEQTALVDAPDSEKFKRIAEELATHYGLSVMDSIDAQKWIIPETELTSEIKFRLDFTEEPSVFQLLIQETTG